MRKAAHGGRSGQRTEERDSDLPAVQARRVDGTARGAQSMDGIARGGS
jgi:hypothetical protein